MTTPTRQEIKAAHESLDLLCVSLFNNPDTRLEKLAAAQTAIEKVLPPKPLPTMAEIEWDDDKHYLAEAEHPDFGKVIMLGLNAYSLIDFFAPERYASRFKDTSPENLTPTGKRYTLTEVQE